MIEQRAACGNMRVSCDHLVHGLLSVGAVLVGVSKAMSSSADGLNGLAEPTPRYLVHGWGSTRGRQLSGGGHDWTFAVVVDGSRWAIRIVPEGFADQSLSRSPSPLAILPDYLEATCDGQRYFQVKSFESKTTIRSRESHAAQGICAPDMEPALNTRELKVLWYLYATHRLLPGREPTRFPPLDPADPDAYRHDRVPGPKESRRQTDSLGLVEYVQCGDPIELLQIPATDTSQLRKGEHLMVLSRTNVGGWAVARTARAEWFLSLAGTNPWIQIEVAAERVQAGVLPDQFIPALRGPTMIEDARFWRSTTTHCHPSKST